MKSQSEALQTWKELMEKQEDLHPELQKFYEPNGGKGGLGWPVLRHPLIYSVPHLEQLNVMMNFRYKMLTEKLEEKLAAKDFIGAIWMHERPWRMARFDEWQSYLKDSEYWKTLGELWTDAENIWQNLDDWKRLLNSSRPGHEAFMDADDRKVYNKLPERVTIYRGFIVGQNKNGLSYTLSKERAEWFSNRFRGLSKRKTSVLRKVVPKADIFAYLGGRGEEEVILFKKSPTAK